MEDGEDVLFHTKHPAYTDWIKNKLRTLQKDYVEVTDNNVDEILNDVILITEQAKDEIVNAWNSGKSLNNYFKGLK